MSRMMLTLLIFCLLSTSYTLNNNCGKSCQNNKECMKKCEEYAKNPNRNQLSDPHCGLSRLKDFKTDYETKGVYGRQSRKSKPKTNNSPWIVSLQYLNTPREGENKLLPHFCSGVIINENFILSSAQCVPKEPGGYQIMVGSTSIEIGDKDAQIVEVEAVLVPGIIYKPWVKRHENFAQKYSENDDILLIKSATKIESKLNGNDFVVNSICLPEPPMALNYKNDKLLGRSHTAGWGYDGPDLSPFLMEVEVPLLANDMANKVLAETRHYFGEEGKYYIYNYTLGKKDLATMANVPPGPGHIPLFAFNGDSGSPIVKIVNGRAYVLGVSHWISKGQNPISVWAQTSYYLKWIEQNIKKTIWQI